MTEGLPDSAALRRAWTWAGWLWLILVAALVVEQVGFWRAPALDNDVMALLPQERQDPLRSMAEQRLADDATRQVVVLLAAKDWPATRAAAGRFLHSIGSDGPLEVEAGSGEGGSDEIGFLLPFRDRLLTGDQARTLQTARPDDIAALALARLFGPGTSAGLTEWRDDPLGLWPGWWQARLGQGVGERDGLLSVERDGVTWALLRFRSASAFRLDGKARIQRALERAGEDASAKAPGLRILAAGVPLHAEAAAVRASLEINTIGWGSLLAVIILMWMAFRSPLPVLLVGFSLAIGCAAGVAATTLVFGKVHLLTLVFGASLVGVAEDYGIHYFACRQSRAGLGSFALMRDLLPGLSLALVTSVLAYFALAAAPFPGLRQMAVFSAAGLTAAFATVACWFPWLDRGGRPPSRFAAAVAASLDNWPRWRQLGPRRGLYAAAFALVLVGALSRAQVHDDLRSLQSSPSGLVHQQREISGILGLPSPAQFFLVRGDSAEQVLQREETLKARLDALVVAGDLSGYSAVSDWVPSRARQSANARLTRAAEGTALAAVRRATGEDIADVTRSARELRVQDWLARPGSAPIRSQWIGEVDGQWASVVLLKGIGATTDLGAMAAAARGIAGAEWVDRTGEISQLLGHYRRMMGWFLLAGFCAVAAALQFRYGAAAWRAWVPTLLSCTATLAMLSVSGEPIQLFTVLAMLLLLGMGVDYGIFLLEHDGDGASWLAVSMGAASTALAFGLLSLSATPALHSFGLTLLLGIALVWLISPIFRTTGPGPSVPDL